jgi:hypothetical protein
MTNKEKQVEWLPISKQFSETLQKWPANTRHEACVSDIVNHTFKYVHCFTSIIYASLL